MIYSNHTQFCDTLAFIVISILCHRQQKRKSLYKHEPPQKKRCSVFCFFFCRFVLVRISFFFVVFAVVLLFVHRKVFTALLKINKDAGFEFVELCIYVRVYIFLALVVPVYGFMLFIAHFPSPSSKFQRRILYCASVSMCGIGTFYTLSLRKKIKKKKNERTIDRFATARRCRIYLCKYAYKTHSMSLILIRIHHLVFEKKQFYRFSVYCFFFKLPNGSIGIGSVQFGFIWCSHSRTNRSHIVLSYHSCSFFFFQHINYKCLP